MISKALGDGGDGVHDHIKSSAQPWKEGRVGKQGRRQRYNVWVQLLPSTVQQSAQSDLGQIVDSHTIRGELYMITVV